MPEGADNSDDFGKEIDRIFNEERDDPEKMQASLVALAKSRAEDILSKTPGVHIDKLASIEKKLEGYVREHMPEKKEGTSSKQDMQDQEQQLNSITPESKKNFEKLLQNFVIYEVYQEMNPRRIAGETEASNYAHNVALRGVEKAEDFVKAGKLSEHDREQIQKKVLKEVRVGRGDLTRRDSSFEMMQNQSTDKQKDRTMDALDLATSLRGSLTNPKSRQEAGISESTAREAQQQKRAEVARNNKGPGQSQGGPGLG